jgi:hypothetical protein
MALASIRGLRKGRVLTQASKHVVNRPTPIEINLGSGLILEHQNAFTLASVDTAFGGSQGRSNVSARNLPYTGKSGKGSLLVHKPNITRANFPVNIYRAILQ